MFAAPSTLRGVELRERPLSAKYCSNDCSTRVGPYALLTASATCDCLSSLATLDLTLPTKECRSETSAFASRSELSESSKLSSASTGFMDFGRPDGFDAPRGTE